MVSLSGSVSVSFSFWSLRVGFPLFIHLRQSQHAQFKKVKRKKKGFFWYAPLFTYNLPIHQPIVLYNSYFIIVFSLHSPLFLLDLYSFATVFLKVEQVCFPSVLFFIIFAFCILVFFLDWGCCICSLNIFLASSKSISVHSSSLHQGPFPSGTRKLRIQAHHFLFTDFSFWNLTKPRSLYRLRSLPKTRHHHSAFRRGTQKKYTIHDNRPLFQSIIDNHKQYGRGCLFSVFAQSFMQSQYKSFLLLSEKTCAKSANIILHFCTMTLLSILPFFLILSPSPCGQVGPIGLWCCTPSTLPFPSPLSRILFGFSVECFTLLHIPR